MNDLSYERHTDRSVEEAVRRLGEELGRRGFGILATLPVHQILKDKIGKEIPTLVILEVCSPAYAYRALEASRDTSLLLPCKIVVSLEKQGTRLALQRPTVVLSAFHPLPALRSLGEEVESKLREALDAAV
jgi:uncharacterized protein (DUF302 family)